MFTIDKSTTRWVAAVVIPVVIVVGVLYLTSVASKVYGPVAFVDMNYPSAVAVDPDGYIFVTDHEWHRIQKIDPVNGKTIRQWGTIGTGDGQFQGPTGIAVDTSGNVYVSDSGNHRVQKFSNKGVYLDQWGDLCILKTGKYCTDQDGNGGPLSLGDGGFLNPWGLIVDNNNNVNVVDSGNARVQKFTNTGNFISKWGSFGDGSGEFKSPKDITFDSSGNAYIADFGNHRIQKFQITNDGVTPVNEWGDWGSQPGYFKNPSSITRDASNNLYITDWGNHRVQKFSSDGALMTHWPTSDNLPGTGNGDFNNPSGIALNPSSTSVYVADSNNHRVQVFDHTGEYIKQFGGCCPPIIK